MSLNIFYNEYTKTLLITNDFNEELKNIPNTCEIIIFKENGTPRTLQPQHSCQQQH